MNLQLKNYTKLSLDEHKQLLDIRNHDYIRKNMTNDMIIGLENHLSWVTNLEEDKTKIYYAIFSDHTLVGGISITDINNQDKSSAWGLFMQKNLNPMIPAISTYLIIDKIFNELNLETLNLEVNKLNTNAYRFDKNFGFIDKGEYDDGNNSYYLMQMDKNMWENNKNGTLLKILKTKIKNSNITFDD